MHIDHLSITLETIHYRCHKHQCIFCHEIPYASLVSMTSSRMRYQVEFKGPGRWKDGEPEQEGIQQRQTCHSGCQSLVEPYCNR